MSYRDADDLIIIDVRGHVWDESVAGVKNNKKYCEFKKKYSDKKSKNACSCVYYEVKRNCGSDCRTG